MTKFLYLFLLFFALSSTHAQNPVVVADMSDCKRFADFRNSFPNDLLKEYYPFISYDKNYFESNNSIASDRFFRLLEQTNKKKVTILHIGDSHIHSDIFTGYVRVRLQNIFGSAGRGLMFPFCTAGTHATRDYRTTCTGNWTSAKSTEKTMLYDVGVTGVTARTTDVSATASIIFRPKVYSMKREPVILSVLYLPGPNAFDVNVTSGKNQWKIVDRDVDNGVITGEIDWDSDTLTISFSAPDSIRNYFELYGIIAGYKQPTGLLYHSAGINGAAIQNLVGQKLIEKHISVLQPDLLILDLGTNDIYRGIFDESVVYKLLTSVIQRVRSVLPDVTILLLPPQDMYYKRRHVVSTESFSRLMQRVAKEKNCLFYNYFQVSGGKFSMLQWEKQQLGKKDRIHLTGEGYELKGKLFLVAFLDAYLKYLNKDGYSEENNSVVYDSACVSMWFADQQVYKVPPVPDSTEVTKTNNTDSQSANTVSNTHIVKKGESLGVIAQKYRVSVSQIQQWNNLSGTTIHPGQKLIIRGKSSTSANSNQSSAQKDNTKATEQSSAKKTTYTVKSGDSLYAIAKANGVTVDQIKKWNNLTTDKIHPGQQLILYK